MTALMAKSTVILFVCTLRSLIACITKSGINIFNTPEILGILFSVYAVLVLKSVIVTKLVISSNIVLISVTLVWRAALETKSVIFNIYFQSL